MANPSNRNTLPIDDALNNLDDFNGHLGKANDGFKDFLSGLGDLNSNIGNLDRSILKNTSGIQGGLAELSYATRQTARGASQQTPIMGGNAPYRSPAQPFMPDMGEMFGAGFQHPSMSKQASASAGFRSGTPDSLAGHVGKSYVSDLNKNMLQMGHSLNPLSFLQYSMMFGASFPVQMKMAENFTRPVTDVAEKVEGVRSFAGGFMGIGDAVSGFSAQMKSPFAQYENLYQSKIMLSSALGGEKQSNTAMDNALKMAREYPVKTEQVLSSLTRLAVYPEVKPNLKDEDFQKKLMETVSGMSLIVPEQGMEGAMFSLVEAMSGSWRSLQMRFNVSPEVVQSLSGMSKGEMSSDPTKLIQGLHTFVSKSIGLDVLEKQKYTFTKQVDNFGDSLQMLTKSVFENTGLYHTATGAATAFQTGFSTLAGNKEFLGYVGGIFQPYQSRLDGAIAKFSGIGVGAYKTMPMSQIISAMEKNFEGLSMEEVGARFESLIDDMGGIWRDTSNRINHIIDGKFGDVLGDIGGDIASVVSGSFANMTSAVLSGVGNTFLNNPMDILAPIGMMIAPLGVALVGAQMVPTLISKGLELGSFSRIGGRVSNAMWGTSNLQVADTLAPVFKKSVQEGLHSGKTVESLSSLNQADRQASKSFVTLSKTNINEMYSTHANELEKARKGVIHESMVNTHAELGRENNFRFRPQKGTADGRTISDDYKKLTSDANRNESISYADRTARKQYIEKLRQSGYSNDDIAKIQQVSDQKIVRDIEDRNYISNRTRKISDVDVPEMTRRFNAVTHHYEMGVDTEQGIQYALRGNKAGLTFQKGDEVTDDIYKRVVAQEAKWKNITDDLSFKDLTKKVNSGIIKPAEIAAYATELEMSPSEFKAGMAAMDKVSEKTTTRLIERGYSDKELSKISQRTGSSVDDLRRGLGIREQLDELRANARFTREVRDNTKSLNDAFNQAAKSGDGSLPFRTTTALQRNIESISPEVSTAVRLGEAEAVVRNIGRYDFGSMVNPAKANKVTRLMRMNESQLSNITFDVNDDVAKTLGMGERRSINVMQAINSPEYALYQREGIQGLTKLDASGTRAALQGDVAMRAIINDSQVSSDVANAMVHGSKRFRIMRTASNIAGRLSGNPAVSGISKLATGALTYADPLYMGYQAYNIASNLGASKPEAWLATGATTGGVGLGMYALRQSMGKELFNRSLMSMIGRNATAVGTGAGLTAQQLTSMGIANAGQSGVVASSLGKQFAIGGMRIGLGGVLTTATLGAEVGLQYTASRKQIQENKQRMVDQLSGLYELDAETRQSSISSGTDIINNKDIQNTQGLKKAKNNQGWKSALMAGGLGMLATAAVMGTGGLALGAIGAGLAGGGMTWATGDYFTGKAEQSDMSKGQVGILTGIAKSSTFYDNRIKSYNEDIGELEFKERAGGGLTPAERSKLQTTVKFRDDAQKNKKTQLGAAPFVSQIYSQDVNEYEGFDNLSGGVTKTVKTSSNLFDAPDIKNTVFDDTIKNTTAAQVINYLGSAPSIPKEKAVSAYLGVSSVAVQANKELNDKYQGASKEDKVIISSASSQMNAGLNVMFENAVDNLDFNNADQVTMVQSAQVGRLNSMIVPDTKEERQQYLVDNQESLVRQATISRIRSSMSTNLNERNLYSTLDVATNQKLFSLGVQDPMESLQTSKEQYLKDRGINTNESQINTLDGATQTKLAKLGITDAASLVDVGTHTDTQGYSVFGGGLQTFQGTGLEAAKRSNKFTDAELTAISGVSDKYKVEKEETGNFNTQQQTAFKAFVETLGGQTDTYKELNKQQDVFNEVDKSGFSRNKRSEIGYTLGRRETAISNLQTIGGDRLQEQIDNIFGKDIEGLSNQTIKTVAESPDNMNKLLNDEGFQESGVFKDVISSLGELDKANLALGKSFDITKQQTEKTLNNAIEKAGEAVSNFASGISSAEDFRTSGAIDYITEMKDSAQAMKSTGEAKQLRAAKDFDEFKTESSPQITSQLTKLGISSVADLDKRDEFGATGLERLRSANFLSPDDMDKVASISGMNTSGIEDVSSGKRFQIESAQAAGKMSFEASASGNPMNSMAQLFQVGNYGNKLKQRASAVEELKTYMDAFNNAEDPEQRERAKAGVSGTIDRLHQLGYNDYSIRAKIGKEKQNQASDIATNEITSKTNNDVMLSTLYGRDVHSTQQTIANKLSVQDLIEYSALETPHERKQYLDERKPRGTATDSRGNSYNVDNLSTQPSAKPSDSPMAIQQIVSQMKEMKGQGMSDEQITEKLGVDKINQVVEFIAKGQQQNNENANTSNVMETVSQMKEMKAQGMTDDQITETLGADKIDQVRDFVKNNEPPNTSEIGDTVSQMKELKAQGMSDEQITETLGADKIDQVRDFVKNNEVLNQPKMDDDQMRGMGISDDKIRQIKQGSQMHQLEDGSQSNLPAGKDAGSFTRPLDTDQPPASVSAGEVPNVAQLGGQQTTQIANNMSNATQELGRVVSAQTSTVREQGSAQATMTNGGITQEASGRATGGDSPVHQQIPIVSDLGDNAGRAGRDSAQAAALESLLNPAPILRPNHAEPTIKIAIG